MISVQNAPVKVLEILFNSVSALFSFIFWRATISFFLLSEGVNVLTRRFFLETSVVLSLALPFSRFWFYHTLSRLCRKCFHYWLIMLSLLGHFNCLFFLFLCLFFFLFLSLFFFSLDKMIDLVDYELGTGEAISKEHSFKSIQSFKKKKEKVKKKKKETIRKKKKKWIEEHGHSSKGKTT